MKNKVLATFVIFAMLILAVFSNSVLATETDTITTTPLGNYRKLIEGEKVLLFQLTQEGDRISLNDIKAAYPEGEAIADKEMLGTGDYVFVNENYHLIALYGDLNGDGLVNTGDAVFIKRAIVDEWQWEKLGTLVGDLTGEGITTGCAIRIQQMVVGNIAMEDLVIKNIPAKEQPVIDNFEVRTVTSGGTEVVAIRMMLSEKIENAKLYLDGVLQQENAVFQGNMCGIALDPNPLVEGTVYTVKITNDTGDFSIEKEFTYRKVDSGIASVKEGIQNAKNEINPSNVQDATVVVHFDKPNQVHGILILAVTDEIQTPSIIEQREVTGSETDITFENLDFSDLKDGAIYLVTWYIDDDGNMQLLGHTSEAVKDMTK